MSGCSRFGYCNMSRFFNTPQNGTCGEVNGNCQQSQEIYTVVYRYIYNNIYICIYIPKVFGAILVSQPTSLSRFPQHPILSSQVLFGPLAKWRGKSMDSSGHFGKNLGRGTAEVSAMKVQFQVMKGFN